MLRDRHRLTSGPCSPSPSDLCVAAGGPTGRHRYVRTDASGRAPPTCRFVAGSPTAPQIAPEAAPARAASSLALADNFGACGRPALPFALLLAPPAAARENAPGAPGGKAAGRRRTSRVRHSATRSSRVWFTLRRPNMTEVYYPDLSHPSARALTFMVDGKPVTTGTSPTTRWPTRRRRGPGWRLIRTYVTDPERATVLIKVRFDSRDGEDHDLELAFDPQLYNDGSDDVGWTRGTRCSRTTPHRLRARRPTGADAHELRLQGPRRAPARAHLRRAAARQRRPAGPHPPTGGPGEARPDARHLLRPGRLAGAGGRRQPLDAGFDQSPRATSRAGSTTAPTCSRSPRRAPVRLRLRDQPARPEGPRGQEQPGRVRRQPEHAVGLGRAEDRPRQPAQPPYHLVWARDPTRSPPPCWRPATRPRATAR